MSKYNEKVFIYAHSIFTITSGILLILMAYCDELIAIFMVLEIINAIAFFLFLRGKRLKYVHCHPILNSDCHRKLNS